MLNEKKTIICIKLSSGKLLNDNKLLKWNEIARTSLIK